MSFQEERTMYSHTQHGFHTDQPTPTTDMGTQRPPRLDVYLEKALSRYFAELDGHAPNELYRRVLDQVEPPLLETVMIYTRGNQSRASEILGISRGTLRTKLKRYNMA